MKRLYIIFAIALWSIILGMGLAFAQAQEEVKPMEILPESYQSSQTLYLETCVGCHLPIPPSLMPTETWQMLLEKPYRHYGTSVDLVRITQVVIWDYLRTFSRPVSEGEPTPLYLSQSRYFKALHPRVDLPTPLTLKTCLNCHPGALKYDYRTLTSDWQNAP